MPEWLRLIGWRKVELMLILQGHNHRFTTKPRQGCFLQMFTAGSRFVSIRDLFGHRTIICCFCDRGCRPVPTGYLLLDHLSAQHRAVTRAFGSAQGKTNQEPVHFFSHSSRFYLLFNARYYTGSDKMMRRCNLALIQFWLLGNWVIKKIKVTHASLCQPE